MWYAEVNPVRNGLPRSKFYCQYTLYTYFESQVILAYILILFIIVGTCCMCCLRGDSEDSASPPTSSVQPVASIRRAQPFMFVVEQVEVRMYHVET